MIKCPSFITEFATTGWRPLKVIVVGAGGTGSALLNKLFQMQTTLLNLGVKGFDVTVYDDDVVTPSNVGRQSFWGFDIGKRKAEVLVSRYKQFGNVNWKAVPSKFTADDVDSNCVIFGCVDNAAGRKEIHKGMTGHQNIIWIDAGNDHKSANVILGMKANLSANESVYLPTVYDLFKSQLDAPVEDALPSCSTAESIARQDWGVNDFAAAHAAQLLWQLIRHGEVAYQGCTVDLRTGIASPLPADPEVWAMFGYQAA